MVENPDVGRRGAVDLEVLGRAKAGSRCPLVGSIARYATDTHVHRQPVQQIENSTWVQEARFIVTQETKEANANTAAGLENFYMWS